MKKSRNSIFAIALSLLVVAALTPEVQAQEAAEGDFTVGGGLSLTTGVGVGFGMGSSGEIGINGGGYYSITDDIRAGAALSIYFGDLAPTQVDIDGHYLFKNDDGLVLYALAGIGYWSWSFDTGFGSVSGGGTSINLGGGVEYSLGDFYLFGEPKLSTGFGTPINILAGLRFRLN